MKNSNLNAIRNLQIQKAYPKKSMPKLAKKYSLTVQRISQIIKLPIKYCAKHQRKFASSCVLCSKQRKFVEFLKTKQFEELRPQIKKYSQKTRDIKSMKQYKKLIRVLIDKHGLSYPAVGRLLKRDHSTIIYNYYSKV